MVLQHHATLTTTKRRFAMAAHELPSLELARQFLDYCPDNGTFTWRLLPPETLAASGCRSSDYMTRRHNNSRAGKVAGHKEDYTRIGLLGTSYKAHRLAWMMHYETAPSGHIDHLNGDKHDNRICNLRDVSCSTNARNREARSGSNSGFRGVHLEAWGRYRAHGFANGKSHHLGMFKTVDEAIGARRAFDEQHGFINR